MNPAIDLKRDAEPLLEGIAGALTAAGRRLAVAESCTGGLIAALCTELPGSSDWFEGGFVTYSNALKHAILGVPETTIERAGAVSAEVVLAMAEGALRAASADWSIAVSGIAGPGGGSREKPVGTVWIAWAARGEASGASRWLFRGDRHAVREQSALAALEGLTGLLAAS